MDQENQLQQTPSLCRNGCGFYSNAGTEGLCSVCYKDMVKKKQQPPNNMPASLTPAPGAMASLSIDESSSNSGMSVASAMAPSTTSPVNIGGTSSIETASPTVILPSEKRVEAESESMSTDIIGGATPSTSDVATALVEAPSPSTSTPGGTPDQPEGKKKKKNRCQVCKKKVGLTGFECRCEGLFCSIHRYSDKHDCKFDYKNHGAEEIRKQNPVIVADKVQKI